MSAEPNPYSVGDTAGNEAIEDEPRSLLGHVWVFVRVVVFSILWMFMFSFGTALIAGFLTGTYFLILASQSPDPIEPHFLIGMVSVFFCEGMGLLGLMLGLLGKLPGTRR